MLSSIHPLGERTRHNRWLVTVAAFTLGSILAGSAVGAVLGWVGSLVFPGAQAGSLLIATGAVALLAGALDTADVAVPGPERQVNEHWIGAYRGWVYGGAFGLQLGAGFFTYVVTWTVYATLAMELLSASPATGAIIGAAFGAGRTLALFLAGRVDRASRLTSFHERMAALGAPVRMSVGYAAMVFGALAVAWMML